MAIVKLPDGIQLGKTATCMLCGAMIPPLQATAGPRGPQGVQELVCARHLHNSRLLIRSIAEHTISWQTHIATASPHYSPKKIGSA